MHLLDGGHTRIIPENREQQNGYDGFNCFMENIIGMYDKIKTLI